MDHVERYSRARDAHAARAEALDRRSRGLGTLRVGVALAGVILLGGFVWGEWGQPAAMGIAGCLVVFAGLAWRHAIVIRDFGRAEAARAFAERGLARDRGEWHDFEPTGEEWLDASHPAASDLDLLGRGSVFQWMVEARTREGQRRLAEWLTVDVPREERPRIAERQDAVRELSQAYELRETLAVTMDETSSETVDWRKWLAWAETKDRAPATELEVGVSLLLSFALAGAIVATALLDRSVWWGAYGACFVFAVLVRRRHAEALGRARDMGRAASDVAKALGALAAFDAQSASLSALSRAAREAGAPMRALARIIDRIDALDNGVFRWLIAPALGWEAFTARALERWRRAHGQSVRAWIDALADVEALSSLATVAFERPDFAFPELVDDIRLEANGLGHPLIDRQSCVRNDVEVGAAGRCGYIVTGSNMSGKSTLLRAMGIAAVMARAGAPVCARSSRIGMLDVVASLRTQDSLRAGISRFYAELERIKLVLDAARSKRRVLFLLDEILHGTNARERAVGARAIVRELVEAGAIGAVSTHDEAICELEAELGGRVENVHFEEQTEGDEMTFDYRLRRGVVSSSNALALMRAVGIDVV